MPMFPHFLLQGLKLGAKTGVLKNGVAISGRGGSRLQPDREHPRLIGVGLVKRDSGLEARDSLVAEFSEEHFVALEPLRQNQVGTVPEVKAGRHHSDHGARVLVDHQDAAHYGRLSAKTPLPIAVVQDDSFRGAGRIAGLGEPAPVFGLHAQGLQRAVGDYQRGDHVRLCQAGYGRPTAPVHPDVLKGPVFLAVSEVHGREQLTASPTPFTPGAVCQTPTSDSAWG